MRRPRSKKCEKSTATAGEVFRISLCLWVLLFAPFVRGAPAPQSANGQSEPVKKTNDSPTVILVLTPPSERDIMEQLETALEAHLRDFDVLVQLNDGQDLKSYNDHVAAARQGLDGAGSLSVAIWFDWEKELVFVMVRSQSARGDTSFDEHVLDRPLPRSAEGEVVIDAVASLARSVLTEWLELDEDGDMFPEETAQPPLKQEISKTQMEAQTEDTPRISHLSYYVAGGYCQLFASFADTLQHGGTLRFGVVLTPYVELGIGMDLLGFIRLSSSTDTIAISRWPLRIRTLGLWPIGRFELGLEASLLLTFSRVHGLEDEDVVSEIQRVDPAFVTAIMLRYQLVDRLSVFAEVGADIYGVKLEYKMNDEILVRLSSAQLRFAIGLAVIFGVY